MALQKDNALNDIQNDLQKLANLVLEQLDLMEQLLKSGETIIPEDLLKKIEQNEKIIDKKDGTQEVVLKRTDGKKFFKTYATVRADLGKALESGELVLKS